MDMPLVPDGAKDLIAESQGKQVVDHFLAQIMVDTKNFVFGPALVQSELQVL